METRELKGLGAGNGVYAQQTKGISQHEEEPASLFAPLWSSVGAVPPDFL